MMAKSNKATQSTTLNELRDAAIGQYGCLIPQGVVTVQADLSWTREHFLGLLKRQGIVTAWKQTDVATVPDSNLRHYEVHVNSNFL
jgi:hypothetical protein